MHQVVPLLIRVYPDHIGTAGSYQMWADQVGDDSYTYENFLPYFQISQNFTPPDQSRRIANATPSYDESVLGRSGKLSVIFPNFAAAFGTWVERGLAAIGINPIDGFQSGRLIGSAYSLATINYDRNVRESSVEAFLVPELGEVDPNLIVFPLTMAKRIMFDSDSRATGVEVDTGGLRYVLNAREEVIVSAGSFQSPQLLMVSGVGPAESLQRHGIDVISDLPGVGQNMEVSIALFHTGRRIFRERIQAIQGALTDSNQDHVLFGTTHRVNVVTGSAMSNPEYANEAIQQFRAGYGPLTNPNVDIFGTFSLQQTPPPLFLSGKVLTSTSIGWEKLPRDSSNLSTTALTDLATFSEDWPEIEYIAPGGYFGYSTNYQENNPTDGYNYATIAAGLVAPLSRGTVDIASNDTSDLPIINPNWLTHPTDRAVAIAAFKRTRDIWESEAMRDLIIGEEYFPGTAEISTDEEIWEFIQQSFSTIFHAACTCKMGRTDDPNTVVDNKARVVGVRGLRVVDASTLPLLPPGHPMATICRFSRNGQLLGHILTDGHGVDALAEKIADDILHGR